MMLTLVLQGFSIGPGVQSDVGDGLHHPVAAIARRGHGDAVPGAQYRLGDRAFR